jgi:structural maintenance of chromosome 1
MFPLFEIWWYLTIIIVGRPSCSWSLLDGHSDALATDQILTKARNFLVFQGDVETIAPQSPTALTRLVEQISGSAQLVKEYEEKKARVERAVEDTGQSWLKRRGINGEIRSYREQKSEAERFEALCQKRVRLPPHLHTG